MWMGYELIVEDQTTNKSKSKLKWQKSSQTKCKFEAERTPSKHSALYFKTVSIEEIQPIQD